MSQDAVLDFKSATLYALRLVLHSADTQALLRALDQRLAAAGDFFANEPVVIDASGLASAPDWAALAQALHDNALPLVGIAASESLQPRLRELGFACITLQASGRDAGPRPGSVHRDPDAVPISLDSAAGVAETLSPAPDAAPDMSAPARATPALPLASRSQTPEVTIADSSPTESAEAPGAQPSVHRPTLILDRALRSGQKVYARNADLIVIGMVSPGAEVIADGNIHVYGPLRGKAMAGAAGDDTARIFTTRLDAELVAVAGIYRVIDTPLPTTVHERPATVRLQGGQLQLQPLAI